MKGQDNLQNTSVQLILIHTEVDIYVNFWTQFPLINNNRQKL